MSAIDYWSELAQGGRLLDRKALEQLPEPRVLGSTFADRLRDALTQVPEERSARGEALSKLLDFVLEDTCGLATGWAKGPAVAAGHSEQLVDGTELKPRRLLTREGQHVLAVFTTVAERIGLHQGRRPLAHAIEYLRRKKIALGLVTNGHEWRLVFADPDNLAWVQWSAEQWLDGDKLHPTLELFRRVLSVETLTPDKEAAVPGLIESIRATRRGQATLSAELGERVRAAVELLLRSRRPVLEPVWASQDPKSVYVAACHFVMRLVVVLFAEGRELLPVDSPIYHHAYGIRGLIEALERAGVDRRKGRTSAWPRLLGLFRLIHGGSLHPQLLVTAYGGDLFRAGDAAGDAVQKALSVLESTAEPPADDVVYNVLSLLTRTTERVREGTGWRTVAAPVDFTELTSEYIGILYEGLLDYELRRAGEEPVVFLGLGEQPALPLDRLEQMDDKQLSSLVEKAKLKKKAGDEEDDTEEEDFEEEADEGQEDAEAPGDVSAIEALLPGDDQRLKAWDRALKWAARAAIAGKLIKAPRNRAATQDPAWKAQLDATAKALIVGLKLPGEFYLVRWGGTRKGAGTFYTRPQLTLPTVRRTLEPLLQDAEGKLRKPEDLLALKVCDPAMGSGSFLVAAIRVLTDKVVEALHVHRRMEVVGDHVRISCDLLPDADLDQPEDRVEAIVRRAVVEHCIYGVDIDPLAVELARVALWVETLDRRLPFTFLDHKLRCGDALLGAWLDRFRDYPLLAWWRQSPDEKWKGVHHKPDVWTRALKDRRRSVVAEQAALLSGQRSLLSTGLSDDELASALGRVRELYRRLRRIPASQPDKRAEIWRTQVAPDPAIARVRDALDLWCALWFWPLDEIEKAPGPSNFLAPGEVVRTVVRAVRERRRFFHWELEFPDVFVEESAGFDGVVGNPPWDTIQAQSKEFFSSVDPLYRALGKQDALRRQRQLFSESPEVETRWLASLGDLRNLVNFARYAGNAFGGAAGPGEDAEAQLVPRDAKASARLHERWAVHRAKRRGNADPDHPFRRQGEGKPYSYKLFVEQAHALLKPKGQLGLITPAGLYTDKGAADLRRMLLDRCSWRWLYGFENREQVFDIHASYKFTVAIAEKGGVTTEVQAAFMRRELNDWQTAAEALPFAADTIKKFSPRSVSIVEVGSERDLDVLRAAYAAGALLGESAPVGWGAEFGREFNITDDSGLFRQTKDWEADGFLPGKYGVWQRDHALAVPVYQGAMINQFDYSSSVFAGGSGHAIQWRSQGWEDKRFGPQSLMAIEEAVVPVTGVRLAFRKIANPTNARTMMAAMIPSFPAVDTIVLVKKQLGSSDAALCALLNSFVFDWVVRLRFGGSGGVGALDHAKMHELPVPFPGPAGDALAWMVMRLNCAAEVFAPSWLAMRAHAPVGSSWKGAWALTRHERLRLRCIADAVCAKLFGLSRHQLRWVLADCDHPSERLTDKAFTRRLNPKGFWRVDRSLVPELRQSVLTLVAFSELEALSEKQTASADNGVTSFLGLNHGDGWMIPEDLRLSDYDLGHDERARARQPVSRLLGPRFLEWQSRLSPEEDWGDCERHAGALVGRSSTAQLVGGGSGGHDSGAIISDAKTSSSKRERQKVAGERQAQQKKLFD